MPVSLCLFVTFCYRMHEFYNSVFKIQLLCTYVLDTL